MDLRERKTRASIRRAFLDLRAAKPLERITVRELVERAEVGKATFYLHYRSVYDLSESLQRQAIDEIVGAIQEPEAYLTAPDRVTRQLFEAFRDRSELIDVLFAGEQAAVLAQSIEAALRQRIADRFPSVGDDPWNDALLTFEIQGGFYAYRRVVRHGAPADAALPAPAGADAAGEKRGAREAAGAGDALADGQDAFDAICAAVRAVTGLMRGEGAGGSGDGAAAEA